MVVLNSINNSRLMFFMKHTLLILAVLFIIISLIPYLIPLQQLGGTRQEQAYSNSIFAEVDGIELHYRWWGDKSGGEANILLVHGLGGSTFSWRYTAPALETDGYRVIAVDLPGFGLSERKEGFDHSADARAKLLWSLLDLLAPGEKWHLVGHSMGGATVAAMTLQKPEQVISITLAAGALAVFEPSMLNTLVKYPPFGRWFRVFAPRILLTEDRVEQLLLSAYGRQPTLKEIEGYYLPLTIKNTDAVLVDLIYTAPMPLLDRVRTLKTPVLCIWGEDDAWVPLEHGHKLAGLLKDARLVILPAEGHCPMETSPEIFISELLNFFEDY